MSRKHVVPFLRAARGILVDLAAVPPMNLMPGVAEGFGDLYAALEEKLSGKLRVKVVPDKLLEIVLVGELPEAEGTGVLDTAESVLGGFYSQRGLLAVLVIAKDLLPSNAIHGDD